MTELELPGVRARRVSTPSTVLASMLNNVYACCSTFVQLYNPKHSRTTYLLMATWFASIFVFHGLTIYISEYSKGFEQSYYNRLTVSINSYELFEIFCVFRSFQLFFFCNVKKRSPNSMSHIKMRISKHRWIIQYTTNATLKTVHFVDCS